MSADPLREKLKALVGELHQQAALYRRGQEISDSVQALAYTQCARKLAALIAESEGEPPCRHGKDCVECEQEREPAQDQHICSAGWRGEPCEICGKSVGGPDCEAKAKLPLGHPYSSWVDGEGPCSAAVDGRFCGQPRSAHEPRRGRLGR